MRDKATAVACKVIADNLLKGHMKCEQIGELTLDEVVAVKRRFVYWDCERARECIAQDYLGVKPTFGPDDFKRIFSVSRANYDENHNYLCGVQSFFKDGHQVADRQKISADGKILNGLKIPGIWLQHKHISGLFSNERVYSHEMCEDVY
jgi:hypothetical protein